MSTISTPSVSVGSSAAPSPPSLVDFSARSITGTVHTSRTFPGMDGFAIVTLTDGRQVVGEWDADDTPTCGCEYRFYGCWVVHDRHGQQFRSSTSILLTVSGRDGTIAYLSRSGLGLTHRQASALWNAYAADALSVLRTTPSRVVADNILPRERADAVSAKLAEDLDAEPVKVALFELFASRGIPRGAVAACIRTWGANAPRVIRRDPFALLVADIPGIGFKRADAIAVDVGYPLHRLKRQMLAGWHALHASTSGNTWEPIGAFRAAVLKASGGMAAARFDDALRLGVRAGWLRVRVDATNPDVQWIAESGAAAAEERLARHVERVRRHAAVWPSVADAAELSPHQRERAAAIAGSAVAILGGTPGTGKTFLAASLLRRLIAKFGEHMVKVCAPTGKAAVRITEAMGRYNLPLKATTVHALLGVAGTDNSGNFAFAHSELNPIEAAVVVVDESSMLDTPLAASLFAALPPGACVLLVGDHFQLPPVGHGAPLRDLIAAGVPTALLEEIRRNAGTIVHACREIKNGKPYVPVAKIDIEAGNNLANVPADGDVTQLEMVISLLGMCKQKAFNPVWDVQVLVPRNGGSAVGRKLLNEKLQAVLNPLGDGEVQENATFRVNDKVICLKNSEAKTVDQQTQRPDGGVVYLANGDMGRVLAATKSTVAVQFFTPDRFVALTTERKRKTDDDTDADDAEKRTGRAGDLDLAYAVTVHKYQGSEVPVAIVVLDENAGPIASREWIYTAISRASKLCITVGSMRTAGKMIGRATLGKRVTFLRELLAERIAPAVDVATASASPRPVATISIPTLIFQSTPSPLPTAHSPSLTHERNGRHVSHITLLRAENFKRLVALTVHPKGAGVTEITGRNGQGKSSCIDAAVSALGGAKWSPDRPIRDGSEWAQVLVETPEYKITRRWWEGDAGKVGDKLFVEDRSTGAAQKSPQSILDRLIGAQQFDPLRFLRSKPKEQAGVLRQITGLDTADLDAERETVFALRTAAKRDVAALQARLDVAIEPEAVADPPAEIDITAMVREIEVATDTRAKNDAARRELDVVRSRIKVLQDELAGLLERERRGVAYCAALVDPDVVAIKGRADAAKEHNAAVRVARERKANVDRLIDQHATLRQSHADAVRIARAHDDRIKEIDAARLAALATVTFPVPGMSIDGDVVTLNGVPFSQASQSQQIRTCFAIAAALSGELRTAFSHEGSLLDDDARADLDKWAVENDVQILLEVVGDGGPGGIVIEDGRVRGDGKTTAEMVARDMATSAAVAVGNAVQAPF